MSKTEARPLRLVLDWLGVIGVFAIAVLLGWYLHERYPRFFPSPVSATSLSLTALAMLGVLDYLRQFVRRASTLDPTDLYSMRLLRRVVFLLACILIAASVVIGMRAARADLGLATLHLATAVVISLIMVSAALRKRRMLEVERALGRFVLVQRRLARANPYRPHPETRDEDVARLIDQDITYALQQLTRTLDRLSGNIAHRRYRRGARGFRRIATIWEPWTDVNGRERFRCVFKAPHDEHPLNRVLEEYRPVQLQTSSYESFFSSWQEKKQELGLNSLSEPMLKQYWEEKHDVTSLCGALWYTFGRGQKTGFVQRFKTYRDRTDSSSSDYTLEPVAYVYVADIDKLDPEDQFFDHYHDQFVPIGYRIQSLYIRVLAVTDAKVGLLMLFDSVRNPLATRTDIDVLEAYSGVLETLMARRSHLERAISGGTTT